MQHYFQVECSCLKILSTFSHQTGKCTEDYEQNRPQIHVQANDKYGKAQKVTYLRSNLLAIAMLLLSACTSSDNSISQKLTKEFDASTSSPIDLAKLGPPTWEKVCVLGPYITNGEAEKVLGFKWDVEKKSVVTTNDGINLLVFVKNREVLAYAEHPRNKGDFLKLQSRCLTRKQSILLRQSNSGWGIQLVAQ